jgi:HTH-type transcriptional regulator/antitoxin HigA
MQIRPIKSEQDYESALKQIESLMGSDKQTDINDLEVLTTLVDDYEERVHPISPPDPIEAIRFRMEQAGLTPRDLIPILGSRSKVSEVLSGKRTLTLPMARALHEHLGIPAESLLARPDGGSSEPIVDWERFPIPAMMKLGWLRQVRSWRARAESLMRDLISAAGGPAMLPETLHKKTDNPRQNAKTDIYGLKAWCYKLIAVARANPPEAEFDDSCLTPEFVKNLAHLSVSPRGPKLAVEYLAKAGIQVVCLPHLPRTYLDGAALRLPDRQPVIGLTLRHDRVDNFWFCLFHELAHVKLHLSVSPEYAFFDDLDLVATSGSKEAQADDWAQEMLIPLEEWTASVVSTKPSAYAVMELAQQLSINAAIVAGRVRRSRQNYRLFSPLVGSGQIRRNFFTNRPVSNPPSRSRP